MCGFIGYINKNESNNDHYKKKFNFFYKEQVHRGPDYSEEFLVKDSNFTLNFGFNRLAIIDLSSKANKIFKTENNLLLFNGEIYNAKKLKDKYLADEEFETKTDTEVLFKLLTIKGLDIINKLEGIFSFAFLDLNKKTISLCKDFTGTKPLYYFLNDDGFFFSSEADFLYSLTKKELDDYALNYYFSFGFSPLDRTLVKGVNKVCPSQIITFNYKTKKLNKDSYYEINKENNFDNNDNLETDLKNVIKKNLISDAKIGVFLSGGLDSSIISLVAQQNNPNIEAYSSFFLPEKKYKKFNQDFFFAEKLCKEFNIKLKKVAIDENNTEQKKDLLSFLKSLDEPIANLNIFNSYLQSKNAKINNCKVILTGDGSDEIFGGYKRYRQSFYAEKFNFLKIFIKKIRKFINLNKHEVPGFFYKKITKKNSTYLFTEKYSEKFNNFKFKDTLLGEKHHDIINYFDIRYWLPEESNYKLDRSTMKNSIEARVPFQDIELLKKYYPIPISKKINFKNGKLLLKKNIKFIPKYIKNRKKIGWLTPESFFLRSYLKDTFQEIFDEEKINKQGFFDYQKLINIFQLHQKGFYYKNELVTILIFQIWYDKVLSL